MFVIFVVPSWFFPVDKQQDLSGDCAPFYGDSEGGEILALARYLPLKWEHYSHLTDKETEKGNCLSSPEPYIQTSLLPGPSPCCLDSFLSSQWPSDRSLDLQLPGSSVGPSLEPTSPLPLCRSWVLRVILDQIFGVLLWCSIQPSLALSSAGTLPHSVTYPSLQEPFHSTWPQGFRSRTSFTFSPLKRALGKEKKAL